MTSVNTTVTASADIEGVFKLMKDAFTSSSKVLLELMQNARRAGSQTVEIEYDEAARVMTVYDDGCGIDDFGTLLKLAKTGWDAKTAITESAFGAGFWSAVFGCERLQVESKGRGFLANTTDILAFKPVVIYSCEQPRTMVRMIGLHKPMKLIPSYGDRNDFERAAAGFSIPVKLNGLEVPRPNALMSDFKKSAVGHILLGGCPSSEVKIYLQGFKVGSIGRAGFYAGREGDTIVHLDSTMFRARAPDRDCLIDAGDAFKAIETAILKLWVEHYEAVKASGDTETLIDEAATLISIGCAYLLNDIPVLPACVMDEVGIDAFYDGDFGRDYREPFAKLSREDAEKITLVSERVIGSESNYSSLYGLRDGDCEFDDALIGEFNRTMYLELLKVRVIRSSKLDAGHWVFRLPNFRSKPLEYPTVSLTDELGEVGIHGRCIDHTFVPCRAITFKGDLGEAGSEDALALIVNGDDAPAIAVGADASTSDLCKMLASFTDGDDHYVEDWFDDDAATLSNELAVARTGNVEILLNDALRGLLYSSSAARLDGRSFVVTISHDKKKGRRLTVKERKAKAAGRVGRKPAKRRKAA